MDYVETIFIAAEHWLNFTERSQTLSTFQQEKVSMSYRTGEKDDVFKQYTPDVRNTLMLLCTLTSDFWPLYLNVCVKKSFVSILKLRCIMFIRCAMCVLTHNEDLQTILDS